MPFSTSRKAQRGSLCINFRQRGCEKEVECLIIPHLTQCHCHFSTAENELSAFVLKSKTDVWYTVNSRCIFLSLLLMIINQCLSGHESSVEEPHVQTDYWCRLVAPSPRCSGSSFPQNVPWWHSGTGHSIRELLFLFSVVWEFFLNHCHLSISLLPPICTRRLAANGRRFLSHRKY